MHDQMLNRRIVGFKFYIMFWPVVVFCKLNFCSSSYFNIFNNIYFCAAIKFKFVPVFPEYLFAFTCCNNFLSNYKSLLYRILIKGIFLFAVWGLELDRTIG